MNMMCKPLFRCKGEQNLLLLNKMAVHPLSQNQNKTLLEKMKILVEIRYGTYRRYKVSFARLI